MTVPTKLAHSILNGGRSVAPMPQATGRQISFGPTGEIIVKTAQCTDHIFRGSVFLTSDQASYAMSWGWSLSRVDSASGLLVMFRR